MPYGKRINRKNDRKGDKQLRFDVCPPYSGSKTNYVYVYAGNAGQGNIPFVGYTDNKLLAKHIQNYILEQEKAEEKIKTK